MCVYILHVTSSSSTAISIPCNKSQWESDRLKTCRKKKLMQRERANKEHFTKGCLGWRCLWLREEVSSDVSRGPPGGPAVPAGGGRVGRKPSLWAPLPWDYVAPVEADREVSSLHTWPWLPVLFGGGTALLGDVDFRRVRPHSIGSLLSQLHGWQRNLVSQLPASRCWASLCLESPLWNHEPKQTFSSSSLFMSCNKK